MHGTAGLLCCGLLLSSCTAQINVNEKTIVARYKSSFSEGKIVRVDKDLMLELNGEVMSHTRDEHVYHEMLVHPAMLATKTPQNVLIIGGAEGATAREVLRHSSVVNITMVDIDKELVEMCRTHLAAMHQGSFDSPKLHVHYEDGANYLGCLGNGVLDAVIVDGIDINDDDDEDEADGKVKYGDALFSPEFYRHIYRVLRPGGIMVQYMSEANREMDIMNAGFAGLVDYGVDIWSYPGFGARFMLAGKKTEENLAQRIKSELTKTTMNMKFLNVNSMDDALKHTARRTKGGGYGAAGVAGAGVGAGTMWAAGSRRRSWHSGDDVEDGGGGGMSAIVTLAIVGGLCVGGVVLCYVLKQVAGSSSSRSVGYESQSDGETYGSDSEGEYNTNTVAPEEE